PSRSPSPPRPSPLSLHDALPISPDLLALTGARPARVRIASWIVGCTFASLTGILIAPTLTLNASLLSALVVQAFGAVAIGLFARDRKSTRLNSSHLGISYAVFCL